MAETFTLIPEYTYELKPNWKTQQTPFELGYVQTRAYWPRPKRKFQLRWKSATLSEREYVESFFQDQVGPAGSFNYSPADPVPTPANPGAASQTAGGSLSARTYYYGITWTTAAGETRQSTERSINLSANNLFTLVLPKFPTDVTSAKIYISQTSGATKLEGTITTSGATFTEPTTGLVGTGAAPPSINTATEILLVHLMEDELTISKVTAGLYEMELVFEEVF